MPRIFSLVRRAVVLPFKLTWKGYQGLWWAFGDEATESGPLPTLARTLKVGFGSTLTASALMGLTAFTAEESGRFSPTTAWVVWLWSTVLAGVISIWAVKHVTRQQALRNPANFKSHAHAAAAGFREMGREVAGAAVKAKDATVNAGKHAAVAGKHVAQAGKTTCEYARRVRSWVRPRPS